ncbi:hypothetical protein FOA43_001674 [Brettanomyces nanus]|uniref:UBC core domain-containing protein n=1 Tax=Eeniella nana TaxID=13502 RepID=A0A875RUA2_EENNA|nr:uncharacterized protein FOA43_001674 [Brettanomyces nanus]QPG74347.1 hypothetical protein FOA43_001674 [Brettanomyces nanus]
MSSPKRRIETDVMKLLMSDYEVTLINDNMQEFFVNFMGPKDSPYEGGMWKIHVELPDQYPYKSPSIGFQNKIFHPNIDEASGSVCLDVINQTWSPMFDMFNIFEEFIPQLLNYPNASDPLNGDASSLYLRDKSKYLEKVKTYVKRYANPDDVRNNHNGNYKNKDDINDNEKDDDVDDEELSSVDATSDDDDDDDEDEDEDEEEEQEEEEEEDGPNQDSDNDYRENMKGDDGDYDDLNDLDELEDEEEDEDEVAGRMDL